MGDACCPVPPPSPRDTGFRRILWVALVINGVMFAAEVAAGLAGDSRALQANALDFLGDSINYGLSLAVLGMGQTHRSGAALIKGLSMGVLGLYVLGTTVHGALTGANPDPEIMGAIGFLALIANVTVAVLLFSHRSGESNRRSVWLCSRNDAIGNVAVLLAASGVFLTDTPWPDLLVAAVMAALALHAATSVIRQARAELRAERPAVKAGA